MKTTVCECKKMPALKRVLGYLFCYFFCTKVDKKTVKKQFEIESKNGFKKII